MSSMERKTFSKTVKEKFVEGGLKISTARNYSGALLAVYLKIVDKDTLQKQSFKPLNSSTSKWFNMVKFQEEFTGYKAATIRNYISAVIAWMKLNGESDKSLFAELSGLRDSLHDEYLREATSTEKTENNSEKWISRDEIVEVFETKIKPLLNSFNINNSKKHIPLNYSMLDEATLNNLKYHIILTFYIYPFINPESDFSVLRNIIVSLKYYPLTTKSKKPTDDGNLFLAYGSKGLLSISDHKSEKSMGRVIIELPQFVFYMLKKWSVFTKLKKGDLLFPNVSKNEITNILIKMTKHYFGKGISTTLLRKIFISWRFNDDKISRMNVARNMLHSTAVQDNIYNKS